MTFYDWLNQQCLNINAQNTLALMALAYNGALEEAAKVSDSEGTVYNCADSECEASTIISSKIRSYKKKGPDFKLG